MTEFRAVARPFPLSAASEDSLKAYAGALAKSLEAGTPLAEFDLAELTGAIAHRRDHLSRRAVFVASDTAGLRTLLDAFAKGEHENPKPDVAAPSVVTGTALSGRQICFTFSGQGSQWWAMGRGLMQGEPVYREALEAFDELFVPLSGWSVIDAMSKSETDSEIDRSAVTQPAICALQIALAALWRHWGVKPAMVVGHSLGEVAAAHVAGAIDLETAVRYIHTRSLMGSKASGAGAMAVVGLPEAELRALLPEDGSIEIAGYNAPATLTITGKADAVAAFVQSLNAERSEVMTREVKTDTAWHSQLLEAGEQWFRKAVGEIAYQTPSIPFISTVTGRPECRLDTDYWWSNLRLPVRFSDAIGTAAALGANIFLELCPHRTLAGPTTQSAAAVGANPAVIVSLNRKHDDSAAMAAALAELYVRGVAIDWNAVTPRSASNIALPLYPWSNAPYAKIPEEAEIYLFERASHPLLGRRLSGPTRAWRSVVNLKNFRFIADHRLREECLFPAAGYMEIMLAAGMEIFGKGPIELEHVKIYEAMFIRQEGSLVVQTVYEPDRSMLRIYSRGEEKGSEWVLRSEGRVRQRDTAVADGSPQPMRQPIRFPKEFWYLNAGPQAFIEFGPMFQCIESVTVETNGYRAVSELTMPSPLRARAKEYLAHPALLDAGLQMTDHNIATLGAEIGSYSADGRFIGNTHSIPSEIGRLLFLAPLTESMTLEVSHEVKDYLPVGNTGVFRDASGRALAVIEDVITKRVPITVRAASEEGVVPPDVLEECYVPVTLGEPMALPPDGSARFVVMADAEDRTGPLIDTLREHGASVDVIRRADLASADLAGIRELVSAALAQSPQPATLVYGWSLDQPDLGADASADDVLEAAERDIEGLVAVGQVLDEAKDRGLAAALVLMTLKARAVPGDGPMSVASLVQAPLVGLSRTIQTECDTTPVIGIDMDEAALASPRLILSALIGENRAEGEIVLRNGAALAPRVERRDLDDLPARTITIPAEDAKTNFVVTMKAPGIIDALELREVDMPEPGEGEALVRIKAVGLNFRDVMAVTGLLPAEAEPDAAYRNLGLEFGGVVAAVGPGVTDMKPGDRVFGNYRRCLQRFIKMPAAALSRVPDHVTLEGAATVPTPFTTAHYGLSHVARLKKGDRILIHVATGGVGLAAIQLAKKAGAEIYATAGSEEKRTFLRSLGIEHVMNSRNLDFADEVMRLTSGRGVDVILNSLPTAYIQKGLEILAPYGRFIEIGKRDVYNDTAIGLKALRRNVQLAVLDLANLGFDNPLFLGQLISEVSGMLEAREIEPLELTTFPVSRVADAFRYMQQARHIGKIVVTFDEPSVRVKVASERPFRLDANASYLVTGGSRGFGLAVGQWLADAGAGRVVLASRSGRTDPEEEARVEAIRAAGAEVETVALDVVSEKAVKALVRKLARGKKPLKGIVHGAAVIEDAFLGQLDEALIDRVAAPKIAGAWNLHRGLAAAGAEVDFLVSFSSTSQLMGSRGQGNYAAANAFLDAFAHWRRSQGKSGFTVDWGPLGGSGFVARNEQLASYMASMGLHLVEDADATRILGRMLNVDRASLACTAIDWPKFKRTNAGIDRTPRLAPLVAGTGAGKTRVRAEVIALPRPEWPAKLALFVKGEIAKVLKIDADAVESNRPMSELGLDSLSSFELKSMIEDEMGLQMSVSQFLQASTVDKLVGLIAGIIDSQLAGAESAANEAAEGAAASGTMAAGRFTPSEHQLGLLAIETGRLTTASARAALSATAELVVKRRLEPAQVEAALATLAERHTMLRLHVEGLGGGAEPALSLGAAPVLSIHKKRDEEVDRPLDIAADGLVRFHLVDGKGSSVLIAHAHAAALDRPSLLMVARELVALASGAEAAPAADEHAMLAAVTRGHYDPEAPASIAHRAFWAETLMPWTSELKLDARRRPVALPGLGRTQGARLTEAVAIDGAALARLPEADVEGVLMTAYGLALADVSRSDGFTIDWRRGRSPDDGALAGPFEVDLPVPFRLAPGSTPAAQLQRTRWHMRAIDKHRDFSSLSVERVMRGEMLAAGQCPPQAGFSFATAGNGATEARVRKGRVTVSGGLKDVAGLLHDVDLSVNADGRGLEARLAYDEDAVSAETAKAIVKALVRRLGELTGGTPDTRPMRPRVQSDRLARREAAG